MARTRGDVGGHVTGGQLVVGVLVIRTIKGAAGGSNGRGPVSRRGM